MKKTKPLKMTGEERRNQIIDIALHLFSENKYQGTTMAGIAEAVGVTEPLIYKHFKNKKEIFIEILSQCHDNSLLMAEKMLSRDVDITQLYHDLYMAYLRSMTKDAPERAKMLILAASVDDEDVRAEVRRFDRQLTRLMVEDLEKKAKKINLSLKFSPQAMARVFTSLVLERAFLVMVESDNSIDSVFIECIDLLFSCLTER